MQITPPVAYVALVILAGAAGLALARTKGVRKWGPPGVICISSLLLLAYVLWTFQKTATVGTAMTLMNWQMPFAAMVAGIDGLSAFFLIPLLILAACCSLYGPQYFKDHPPGRSHWLFFGLLVSGMVMVLLARNAILFILAWEVMSLSSFFLVITDKENRATLRAGWIYFITAHIGTAFLFALFLLLGTSSGSFDLKRSSHTWV